MRRLLLGLALTLVLEGAVSAAVLRVNGGPGTFTNIAGAVAAAAPHDTILVSASSFAYTLTSNYWYIDRPVHIIGSGWPTSDNSGTTIDLGYSNHIVLTGAASGTTIESISIINTPASSNPAPPDTVWSAIRVEEGCVNVQFIRLLIEARANYQWPNYPTNSNCILLRGNGTVCVVSQSGFYRPNGVNGDRQASGISVTGLSASVLVTNSVFSYLLHAVSGNQVSVNFDGCDLWYTGFNPAAGWSGGVGNCIFYGTGAGAGALQFSYNGGNGGAIGVGWTGIMVNPFVNLPDGALWHPTSRDIRLAPGVSAIDAGNPAELDRDGSRRDLGVYGGLSPFQSGALPSFPIVTVLQVPASVPLNGVLPIFSTGRVGGGE